MTNLEEIHGLVDCGLHQLLNVTLLLVGQLTGVASNTNTNTV